MNTRIRKIGDALLYIGTLLMAILLWLIDANFDANGYSSWNESIRELFIHAQGLSWVWLIIIILLFAIGYLLKVFTPSGAWIIIKTLIDDCHEIAYPDHQDGAMHEHRITLYQYQSLLLWPYGKRDWTNKPWYNPWGRKLRPWTGWLVPKVRSGHTTQSLRSVFIANKNRAISEGVCGQAWLNKVAVKPTTIRSINQSSAARRIDQYCKDCWGDPDMVKKRLKDGFKPPLAIAAIPIKVHGEIWGILCLDSVSPDAISESYNNDLSMIVRSFERLLENMT